MFYVYAVTSAFFYAVGSIYMAKSQGLSQLVPALIMFSLYLGGATFQTFATSNFSNSMGLTYMFVLGLEALIAPTFGAIFLQERYGMLQLAGISMIVCGVITLRSVKI
jgi:multidrug transporter EmrE-like cation transporter